jgi:hypothetical protein
MSTRPPFPARLFQAAVAGLFLCFLAGPAAAAAAAVETPTLTAPDPGPGDADPALYAPVLADDREDVYADTAGRLSRYRLDATLNPVGAAPATIVGSLDLSFYNGTGAEQTTLYLRLYANAGEYADGGMELARVVASGERIEPRLDVGGTVAEVQLPRAVAPEQTADLRIDFTTTIPTDPKGSYGMFKYDTDSGTYSLAHWEPLLAGYDPVTGWNLDPPSVNGDPVFTNAAIYDVTLTAPSDLVVVTTGREDSTAATDDGRTRHHFLSGPVRDFVMAADADFQSDSMTVDGTTVTSW